LVRCEAELLAPLGPEPTFGQKLLACRAARLALRLELYDEQAARGKEWTGHDLRAFHALQNNLRLLVREIGQATPAPAKGKLPSLAEIVAEHAGKRP